MTYLIIASIFNEQIQIGKTKIPLGLVFLSAFFMTLVAGINIIYFKRYKKIMSYLQKKHPEIYEQVRRKPDVGSVLYSSGYKHSKPLIELSKKSKILNDIQAEKMLIDFVEFDKKFNWVSTITVVLFALLFFVFGIILYS